MKKKAQELLVEQTIFVVLATGFLLLMYFIINRAGSSSTILEQEYSKIIALIIDKAKANTNITMDLSELYDKARINRFNENEILKIDNKEKKVTVKLVRGSGYSYYYFNNVSVLWNMKSNERRVYMEVVK